MAGTTFQQPEHNQQTHRDRKPTLCSPRAGAAAHPHLWCDVSPPACSRGDSFDLHIGLCSSREVKVAPGSDFTAPGDSKLTKSQSK